VQRFQSHALVGTFLATVDGTYTFAIKATDSSNPQQTARVQFTLQIAEPLVITTSSILPNACVNRPYSFQMQTNGGLPPITFGAGSGTLWVGINVDPVPVYSLAAVRLPEPLLPVRGPLTPHNLRRPLTNKFLSPW